MDERRRFVRASTRQEVAYTVLPSGTTEQASTRDISGGGLRLVLEKPLAAGTQVQLAIPLPGQDAPVNAIGEVVWSEQQEVTGKTSRQSSAEIGIRAKEISPQDQELLMHFVAQSLQLI